MKDKPHHVGPIHRQQTQATHSLPVSSWPSFGPPSIHPTTVKRTQSPPSRTFVLHSLAVPEQCHQARTWRCFADSCYPPYNTTTPCSATLNHYVNEEWCAQFSLILLLPRCLRCLRLLFAATLVLSPILLSGWEFCCSLERWTRPGED